jgi:hypothetical protein
MTGHLIFERESFGRKYFFLVGVIGFEGREYILNGEGLILWIVVL